MNYPILWKAFGIALIATTLITLVLGFLADGMFSLGVPEILLVIAFATTLGIFRFWPHFGMWKVVWLVFGTQIFVLATAATVISCFCKVVTTTTN